MPYRPKFGIRKSIINKIETLPIINESSEIDLEIDEIEITKPKLKSKQKIETPRINNKSKVNIIIPNKKKKKPIEYDSE